MGLGVTSLATAIVVSLSAGVVSVACGGPNDKQVAAATVLDTKPAPTTATTARPVPSEATVGDVVPVGAGGNLAVLAVEENVSAGRLFNPPQGSDYFAAQVKACSGPAEKDLSFSPEYFLIVMATGGAQTPTLGVKKPDLRPGAIPAGKCSSGWVTWVVPEGAEVAGVAYNGSSRIEWRVPVTP